MGAQHIPCLPIMRPLHWIIYQPNGSPNCFRLASLKEAAFEGWSASVNDMHSFWGMGADLVAPFALGRPHRGMTSNAGAYLELPIVQAVARCVHSQCVIVACQGVLCPQVCLPPDDSIPVWAGLVHPGEIPAGECLRIRKSTPWAAGCDLLNDSRFNVCMWSEIYIGKQICKASGNCH